MTPKEARFVAEYLKDFNGADAVRRAGYKVKRPDQQAYELLRKPEVARAVADEQAKALSDAKLTATRVLEEYRRIAFLDTRSFYDEAGNLKPVQEWTADQGAAVAQFETLIKNAKAGDGQTDTVHKVRLVDKTRALESLAKHFGLLTEKVDHGGTVTFQWQS